ncbi:hypothetical protein Ga0100231_004955 [Opitutaceae bacterium TAV4]|nr:hypothetical protein Ga0100231_004955 [Opitutaceae bacterium TAV4]RRK02344.1 hypothetical protein Ga0100230_004100 [Opitutaceae bacterium TAV3]
MKKLIACLGLIALFLAFASAVFAATTPVDSLVAALPESVQGIAASLLAKVPSWIFTILTVYGTLSLAYQALIAWWHAHIAETTSETDNQWTDKLTSATWFKILDKFFYFGGYIGSALGGKKL